MPITMPIKQYAEPASGWEVGVHCSISQGGWAGSKSGGCVVQPVQV